MANNIVDRESIKNKIIKKTPGPVGTLSPQVSEDAMACRGLLQKFVRLMRNY